MATTETTTPTKSGLTSFQVRRNRWKNAPRGKLVAMPKSPLPGATMESVNISPLPPSPSAAAVASKARQELSLTSDSAAPGPSATSSGFGFSGSGGKPITAQPPPSSLMSMPSGLSSALPSAYPPMSGKAPKPAYGSSIAHTSSPSSFVTPKAKTIPSFESSSTSSAAFPPMSTKAPTPFGAQTQSTKATSATTSKRATSSAAFPPMSVKAPTPFGAQTQSKPTASTAKSSSSAAFPPMSAKAPTPFGALQTKTTTAVQAPVSSAAFPPMSAKAPTPFGASQAKPTTSSVPKSTSSAAFPPMSVKAPTPFGGQTTKAATTTSSAAAFPPMSAKAPTPFSSIKSKTTTTKASSAAFPPMSTKAPTPFGAASSLSSSSVAKNATGSIFGSSATPAFGASTSSSPFNIGSTASPFGAATLSSSSTQAGSYPPMATKAPTPFGGASAAASNTTASSSGSPNTSHKQRLVAFYKKHNPSKLDTVDTTLAKFKGKEDELFQKLETKYNKPPGSSASPFPLASGEGPTCFVEFAVDGKNIGRVVVNLYKDKAPLAAENFRCLCTGEITLDKRLTYLESKIHRIVPGFCIQMGDITRGDGRGGKSIYPPNSEHGDAWGKFKDEPFMQHSKPGLLSMANSGKNTNSSQVFFTLKAVPYLDGKHVVFGEVTKGFDVVEALGKIETNQKTQVPVPRVTIAASGEIVDGKDIACPPKEEAKSTPFGVSSAFGSNASPFGSTSAFGSNTTGASPFSFGTTATPDNTSLGGDSSKTSGFSFGAPSALGNADTAKSSGFNFGGTSSLGSGSVSAFGTGGGGQPSFGALASKAANSSPSKGNPFTFGTT